MNILLGIAVLLFLIVTAYRNTKLSKVSWIGLITLDVQFLAFGVVGIVTLKVAAFDDIHYA